MIPYLSRLYLSLKRKPRYFFVFDIGGFSVKALLVEMSSGQGGPVVHASANEIYVRQDLRGDAVSSPEAVYDACKKARDTLTRASRAASGAKQAIVGLSGNFVAGKSITQFYNREHPEEEIDQTELQYILQHTEQRAYEEARRGFAQETGRSDIETHIFQSAVQEVKIDGYRVANPLGFTGQELHITIFNAYISRVHVAYFARLFDRLGLTIASLSYVPYTIHRSFAAQHTEQDALFVDAGGSETILGITRKGKLEHVGTIAIGGTALTQKLARELDVGFWEAEHIKLRYNESRLSASVTRKITRMLDRELAVFLSGIELVLGTIAHANLLPADIYLYGGTGGSAFIQKAFKKKAWKENLSFIATPKTHIIEEEMFSLRIAEGAVRYTSVWTPAFSLAQFYAYEYMPKGNQLDKALRRMVKIIQE